MSHVKFRFRVPLLRVQMVGGKGARRLLTGLSLLRTVMVLAISMPVWAVKPAQYGIAQPDSPLDTLSKQTDWVPEEHLRERAASQPKALQVIGLSCSSDSESLTAAPFAIPLDNARITSPFGMRFDPVKRFFRKHAGVDFAAPAGTPVRAAESGIVESVSFDRRGYGRYVIVQHEGGYATSYAHLSTFAEHLRAGVRVRVGQLIGKVGRTGDATGPHLHFEVRYQGEPIDPLAVMQNRVSSVLAAAPPVTVDMHVGSVLSRVGPLSSQRKPQGSSIPQAESSGDESC